VYTEDLVRVIKSVILTSAGHAAQMEEMINMYKILI
jgi:hypothetical protein